MIELDSRTMLLRGTAKDILKRCVGPQRKGIDIKLYCISEDGQQHNKTSQDSQTVVNFLSSQLNPSVQYQKTPEDLDKLLSEQLDSIIIQDRVRSCSDYYKVNNKKVFGERMQIG